MDGISTCAILYFHIPSKLLPSHESAKMRCPVASVSLKLICGFLATFFACASHASSVQVNRSPLVAVRYPLNGRQTSYQQDPSTILWPPDCTPQDSESCLGSAAVKTYTVKDCSKMVALTCWTHVYYIDFKCLCESMSSTTCPSCDDGIDRELYLAWLALYCEKSPGWSGLQNDWNAALAGYETLEAGQVNAVITSDPAHFQTENPFTSQFITDKHTFIDDHHLPSCTLGCTWLNAKWNSSFLDGIVASALGSANVFQANYTIGDAPQSGKLYVDLSVFCTGWVWSDLQSKCTGLCSSNLDPTSLLLWLNATCGSVAGFAGLADDWQDSLFIVNSTFPDIFERPSCLGSSDYPGCRIGSIESSCTRTLCNGTDENGDCSSVPMVNMICFLLPGPLRNLVRGQL